MLTVYLPGGKFRIRKTPSSLVVADWGRMRFVLETVTVMPGTAPPLLSTTEPSIVPVVDVCAIETTENRQRAIANRNNALLRIVLFIFQSFLKLFYIVPVLAAYYRATSWSILTASHVRKLSRTELTCYRNSERKLVRPCVVRLRRCNGHAHRQLVLLSVGF